MPGDELARSVTECAIEFAAPGQPEQGNTGMGQAPCGHAEDGDADARDSADATVVWCWY